MQMREESKQKDTMLEMLWKGKGQKRMSSTLPKKPKDFVINRYKDKKEGISELVSKKRELFITNLKVNH